MSYFPEEYSESQNIAEVKSSFWEFVYFYVTFLLCKDTLYKYITQDA